MILLQCPCRYLLQVLTTQVQNLEKGVELDCQWVEFDDVRYHIQALDRAKPDSEKADQPAQNRSFKRLSIKDGQGGFNSR
ncbi:UNVERIFIED_CONTAM: Actin-related protein 2/3 complex subunitA [Sesamum latifolium]|uniref:Actin-related protein 2/3 complex subunitA n=1 Tax=Sesamum latifolium TaxID=2727402 RepID=A0AAW2XY22_9LAMI